MQKSNLLAAMGGRRQVPVRARAALNGVLGLDENGQLARATVHQWRCDHAESLRVVVSELLGSAAGWPLVQRGRAGPGDEEQAWLLAGPDGRQENVTLAVMVCPRSVLPELAEECHIRCHEAILEVDDISGWLTEGVPHQAGQLLFERALQAGDVQPSWERIIAEADRRGVSRRQVWAFVESCLLKARK